MFFLSIPNTIFSTIIYVNLAASGTETGMSWENAFTDLQDAIAFAELGDTVWVAKGTYLPTNDTDRTKSFILKSGLTLYGGFAGGEGNLEERNFASNETSLSGDIGVFQDNTDNSFSVLYARNCTAPVTLDGFVIKDGFANDLTNCLLDNQRCFGGGMFIESVDTTDLSNIIIRNCHFVECAAKEGGAIKVECILGELNLTISDCEFSLNKLYFENSNNGGAAIKINSINGLSRIHISNTSFFDNQSGFSSGGAIHYDDDDDITDQFIIDSCVFLENISGDGGGAIFMFTDQPDSIVTISNTIFRENVEYGSGGGAISANGYYAVKNSIFSNNSASRGGATLDWGAISEYVNCVFSNNYAAQGGVLHQISNSKFINCTLYGNSAIEGAVVYGEIATDTFYNTIFWNNTSNDGNLFVANYPDLNSYDLQNCLIDIDNCFDGTGLPISCNSTMLYNINPDFIEPSNENFLLNYCSPAIDKGLKPIVETLNVFEDLNGNQRIKNNLPDLGAYEVDGFALEPSITDISCFNFDDGSISVLPQNGFPPYVFEWENGQQDSLLNMLSEGIYNISVRDSNNCTVVDSFSINNPLPISFEYEITPATGQDSTNGAIEIISIEGGTFPFQYFWSSSDTSALASDLLPGEYSLTITDKNGCDTIAFFLVDFISSNHSDNLVYGAQIAPNPTSNNNITIQFSTPKILNINLQVVDITGKELFNSPVIISKGETWYRPPVTFHSGIYFINLVDNFGYHKCLRLVVL